MPFHLLKQIIGHLQQRTFCPFCESQFPENSIFVLMSSVDPENGNLSAIFFVICPQCMSQAFVRVNATPAMDMIIKTKPAQGISVNDMLDMHNFLKTWEGDIKEVL